MPIAAIFFLPSFYFVVINVFREREKLCHGPTFGDSLEKSEIDSKERFFLEIIIFWDKNLTKAGQIQREDLFLEITMFLRRKIDKLGQI